MIIIGRPYIEELNNKTRCICDISIDDKINTIWFEVEKKYGKYLCTERADAYLIGLLSYALRNNHNIKCEVPVTEQLLYQIREVLVPSLVKHSSNMNMITIEAQMAPAIATGTKNGTGLSCGIDSFWSIYEHINTEYKELDLDYLCINNVGAFNECYSEYGEEKVKDERYQISRKVAKEIGLELIETDSNFGIIEQNHLLTCSYSSCFAIYMLQKLWKNYYLGSNGIDYANFSLENHDLRSSEQSELLLLQCFSINSLKIYCDGGGNSRLEKTERIINYNIAQKYLHVCIKKPYNCNMCLKCKRTLVTLDLLDCLDKFENVFDISYYKKNKIIYYRWLCREYAKKNKMNIPVYESIIKKKDFRKKTFFYRILFIPAYRILYLIKHKFLKPLKKWMKI